MSGDLHKGEEGWGNVSLAGCFQILGELAISDGSRASRTLSCGHSSLHEVADLRIYHLTSILMRRLKGIKEISPGFPSDEFIPLDKRALVPVTKRYCTTRS